MFECLTEFDTLPAPLMMNSSSRATQRMLLLGTSLAASVVSAAVVNAQTCVGGPELSLTPKVAATNAAGTDLNRTLVARYGISGQRFFGGVQAGVGGYKFASLRTPIIGGDVGFAAPIGAGLQLCPVLQSLYQHGSNNSFGDGARSARSSLGLSLGRAFAPWSSVAVVPFVQGNLLHLYMNTPGPATENFPSGSNIQTRRFYGEFGGGFGLRINDKLTVTPAYRMPFAAGDADTYYVLSGTRPPKSRFGIYQQQYSVSVSLGFGRQRAMR